MQSYDIKIATITGARPVQVASVIQLLDEGGTIPFISRYRKEATGGLDEVAIASIRDSLEKLRELDKRREAILKSLEERELLTDELRKAIMAAETMTTLEDIYLPYKPKRRTRATKAREMGLEPLADLLFEQKDGLNPEEEARVFIDPEKGVDNVEIALQGARDIIAEKINEDAEARAVLREYFARKSVAVSKVIKGQEELGAKFSDYFEYHEEIRTIAGHRVLALFRGEREAFLRLKIQPDRDEAILQIRESWVLADNDSAKQVDLALEDAYKRLLSISLENELRNELKEKADIEAIKVFAGNLRELLLYPPFGQRPVLAIDPGFRTGCKVVMLDAQGKLLKNTTIFPTTGGPKVTEAEHIVMGLCAEYKPAAVAIGNGTASRETESFFRALKLEGKPEIVVVNESGASVYSASEAARREFPDYDLTVRGAVSIGRRLQDPLAELVKIDPKAIGVGQYQHDVDQNLLRKSLDDVVTSCVNTVGVELNSASMELLTYVSGLGGTLADNIVKHREENGPFKTRSELLGVTRLGPKAYEQCAGFLRVSISENPLDQSAVHPESYPVVERMAADSGCTISDLMSDSDRRKALDLTKYVDEKVGLPTLHDIIAELEKPGRDPRGAFESFSFKEGVETMSDLEVGMELNGIVTNVTNFGAFVDVGVHQDGLVHVSELADRFVKDPLEVVKVHQKVKVRVMEIDEKRKRISLSMKKKSGSNPQNSERRKPENKPPKDTVLLPEDLDPKNGIRIGRLKKKK